MTGGEIKTPTGWADALAIRGGVIMAVGGAATINVLRGPKTEVLMLSGSAVLPGLFDVHVHPLFAGLSERECKIVQGSTFAETQRGLRACASKREAGEWVIGGQWDASALG